MKTKFLIVTLLVLGLSLTGCARNLSPNTYSGSEVNVSSSAQSGVIIAKRPVNIDNNTGVGGIAGAATGAAAGSLIGGSPVANIIGAIGGAVVGGVAGNAIDGAANRHLGYEYIIKLNNGKTISVVQAQDMVFSVRQRVIVITGPKTRIIPDDTSA